MSAVQTLPQQPEMAPSDPDLLHAVCSVCYPIDAARMFAVCGVEVDTVVVTIRIGYDDLCVVCLDLIDQHCERCGA